MLCFDEVGLWWDVFVFSHRYNHSFGAIYVDLFPDEIDCENRVK